jgi:hypothetical protein
VNLSLNLSNKVRFWSVSKLTAQGFKAVQHERIKLDERSGGGIDGSYMNMSTLTLLSRGAPLEKVVQFSKSDIQSGEKNIGGDR